MPINSLAPSSLYSVAWVPSARGVVNAHMRKSPLASCASNQVKSLSSPCGVRQRLVREVSESVDHLDANSGAASGQPTFSEVARNRRRVGMRISGGHLGLSFQDLK